MQTTLLAGTDGAVSQGMEVGLFVLGSPQMEEAVYVGYDGASVFVDMRNSSQVIPTPLHVLGRISPIFSPFFPVFCAFSPSRRGGSNEPKTGIQDQETASRAPKHRFSGLANSGCWERMEANLRKLVRRIAGGRREG